MYYTYDYTYCDNKESACTNFICDFFIDYIPPSILDYLDHVGIVENVLELKVISDGSGYFILSKKEVEDLRL